MSDKQSKQTQTDRPLNQDEAISENEDDVQRLPDVRYAAQIQRSPQSILQLQSLIGNQAVQRLLSTQQPAIQRDGDGESSDSDREGERTIQMLIATIMDDMIGHAWVIFEHSNGHKETWGFYPTDFEGMGPTHTDPVPGRVTHPDPHHNDEPSSTYGFMVNHQQYRRAVRYANRQQGRQYQLDGYNCSAFARGMLEAATGDAGPGLLGRRSNTPFGIYAATYVRYLRSLF